jgi:general secretion pathway protein D
MKRLAALLGVMILWAPLAGAGNRKGDKLLEEGRFLEAKREYDKALECYEKAIALDPRDTAYNLAARRVRFAAAQRYVDNGQKLRQEGKLEDALAAFQKGYAIDPSSSIAEQEIRRTIYMIEQAKKKPAGGAAPEPPEARGLTPAERARREAEQRAASLLAVPELKPVTRQVTNLKIVNQSPKVIYETLGKLTGVNVLFEADYADQGKKYSLDLTSTTLEDALDYASVLTKSFWKPLSANTIFVLNDNPTKRREHEEQVTRIFYLQNVTSPQELQEVMSAMRTVVDVRKVFPVNSQSAIAVRGSADQVSLAEKVLLDLDKAKPEVLVDILVMEANRTKARDIAITPVSGGKNGISLPISFTGGGESGSVPLNELKNLNGGDWSVVLPGAMLQALMSDRQTRVMTTPQVRATDGQKATLRLGDRYPYATGSFQPGIGGAGINPLVQTQFQFADVGVNVDVTPRIHGGDEVSLQVEFEISTIRERIDVGGLQQPVIGQRRVNHVVRLKEGEVTMIGGLMQSIQTRTKSGVAGLASVPVLGWFFSGEGTEKNDADLLVALVPHIVRSPDIRPENLRGVASGTDQQYKVSYAPPPLAAKQPEAPKPQAPPAAGPPAAPAAVAKPVPMAEPQPAAPQPSPAAPGEAAPPPPPGDAAMAKQAAAVTPDGAKLAFQASATEVALNQTVTVNLNIANVKELFAAPMRIAFNSSILRLTEVSRGGFLSSDGAQVTFSETKLSDPGGVIVSMNRVPGAGGVSGQGTLLTLKFQAVGRGVAMLSFEELVLRDARLNNIAVQPPSMAIQVK